MTTVTTNQQIVAESAGQGYRYSQFTLPLMLKDFSFGASALRPGNMVPDVTVSELDGATTRLSELFRERPVVLLTASLSCPMTSSSVPLLTRLSQEFAGDFNFVFLYVREAHPGELLPQSQQLGEKTEHAIAFKEELAVYERVVVDDVDGTLHRLLDAKPNAAFIFDTGGRLLYRSLWGADEAGLRSALKALKSGSHLRATQSTRMIRPMLRALGYVSGTMTRAGTRAHRDLLVAAAPMELLGLMAGWLRPLSPDLRGPALIVAGSLALAVLGAGFLAIF